MLQGSRCDVGHPTIAVRGAPSSESFFFDHRTEKIARAVAFRVVSWSIHQISVAVPFADFDGSGLNSQLRRNNSSQAPTSRQMRRLAERASLVVYSNNGGDGGSSSE
jgi:hypothetical protein